MIINAKTILTGLFASPSTHSISPIMHNNAFEKLGLNFAYLSFEVNKDNLKDAVKSIKTLNMRGVNLSMPNKKEVIQYLDEISEIAKLSQSVNTIVNDNGILKGYSTDGKGFFKSLEEENIDIKNKNITILGTGGASISIISQAVFEGINNIFVFKRDKNWDEQKKILDNIASKTNCKIELYSLENKNILKNNEASINELEIKASQLKKEKIEILKELNLPTDYLQPFYECKICNDTGYIMNNNYKTEMCNCLKQKLLNYSFNKSNMSNLDKENFNTFNENIFSDEVDLSKYKFNISPRKNIINIKNKCIDFVNNFDNINQKNLLFTGNTGLR